MGNWALNRIPQDIVSKSDTFYLMRLMDTPRQYSSVSCYVKDSYHLKETLNGFFLAYLNGQEP